MALLNFLGLFHSDTLFTDDMFARSENHPSIGVPSAMSQKPNSMPENAPAVPDDKPPQNLAKDPLECLPFAPSELESPMAALATRMTRPETLALIDRQIAKRRADLERLSRPKFGRCFMRSVAR